MLPLPAGRKYEEGLPLEIGILGFQDSTVPVSGGIGEGTVYSSTPWYGGRGASISFKELHMHLPLHRPAREARLWAEVENEAYRQGRQGFRGVSPPSHHRLSPQINQLYRVRFCNLAYGKECYLILMLRIHSLLHQL